MDLQICFLLENLHSLTFPHVKSFILKQQNVWLDARFGSYRTSILKGELFSRILEQLDPVAPLEIFSWVLTILQWFLVQIKAEFLLEKIQKFFTPLY